MKATNYFQQNRPVHLARRDVYFESAAKLIYQQGMSYIPDVRLEEYKEILFLLRVARQQAYFSIRETGRSEVDEQFCHFISLLTNNVKAVLSMMKLKEIVESSDGSFVNFLGANQASVALMAEEYQRQANGIIRLLDDTLKLAEEPFELLKVENSESSTDEERERYCIARAHFDKQVEEGRHRYTISVNACSRDII